MREANFEFSEGLTKGLRRFSPNPRDSQSMVVCHNWEPDEQGLEPHEIVTLVNIANTYDQTP